ncbi:hypothetical protein SUGI_0394390 [Cryptomeria japonica]|nr:hypothetical protein SUGI_0394390 [Cryptomeria japonica]
MVRSCHAKPGAKKLPPDNYWNTAHDIQSVHSGGVSCLLQGMQFPVCNVFVMLNLVRVLLNCDFGTLPRTMFKLDIYQLIRHWLRWLRCKAGGCCVDELVPTTYITGSIHSGGAKGEVDGEKVGAHLFSDGGGVWTPCVSVSVSVAIEVPSKENQSERSLLMKN